MSAFPSATYGRAGEVQVFYSPLPLFILSALSISALTCFLFLSHSNSAMPASFCSLTDGFFSPTILQRGDPRGRGAAGAESRSSLVQANTSLQISSARLASLLPKFLCSLSFSAPTPTE